MRNLKRFCVSILALTLALGLTVPAFANLEDTGFSDVDATMRGMPRRSCTAGSIT